MSGQMTESGVDLMYITWIGQSGYILTDGITEICIDPYLSNVVDRIAHRGRMVEAPIAPEELNSDITAEQTEANELELSKIAKLIAG